MNARPAWSTMIVVMGVMFVASSLVAAYFVAIRPMQRARASRAWFETTCHVFHAEVTSRRDSDHKQQYRAVIEYGYDEASGAHHTGDRVAFTLPSSSSSRGDADALVARYPEGADVPCWYDPASPGDATLSREVAASFFFALPLIFFAIGQVVLGFGARRLRSASPGVAGSDGRVTYVRRASGAPEVIGAGVIIAVLAFAAWLMFDLELGAARWVAVVFVGVAVAWFVIELRGVSTVVTLVLPATLAREEHGRYEVTIVSPWCTPPTTARAVAIQTRSRWGSMRESKLATVALFEGALRIDTPPSHEEPGLRVVWYVEVRARLPFGLPVRVRAPFRVT